MTVALQRVRAVEHLNRYATAAAILFAGLLPFFYDSGSPFIEDAVIALAYVVMALGLNIIVGFAGLLDLGYVAFFAIGAYTIGVAMLVLGALGVEEESVARLAARLVGTSPLAR
ncbi:MAG: hypothetical protein KY469_22765 [Actinobacteria bacterium]|nr:hypothetical protein [Actinomycetota bacterium]